MNYIDITERKDIKEFKKINEKTISNIKYCDNKKLEKIHKDSLEILNEEKQKFIKEYKKNPLSQETLKQLDNLNGVYNMVYTSNKKIIEYTEENTLNYIDKLSKKISTTNLLEPHEKTPEPTTIGAENKLTYRFIIYQEGNNYKY